MFTVKQSLLENRITIGTWIQIGHPVSAEILARAGYDWIVIDCEHTDIDIECFSNLARAMYGRGPAPIVRVRENNTLFIRQVLDAGAAGIIVPLVNSAEEAIHAVKASKYLPEGKRGYAFSRANNWGVDFDEYSATANKDIFVIVMIESKEAVENIGEILSVEGIDGVFIGPYDMSGSYGVTGQVSHPLLLNAYKKVIHECRMHGKPAGIHLVNPDLIKITSALKDGFTFLAMGMDTVFLSESARETLQLIKMMLREKAEK